MNTPTISAVLPVASGNAGHTQNGSGAEPENSPPFSDVLTRQRSAEPSQATPASANSQNAATNAQAATGPKGQTDASKDTSATEGDEPAALAQAAAAQGLRRPTIALQIAAEVDGKSDV